MIEADLQSFGEKILGNLNDRVFGPIYAAVKQHPEVRSTLNPALPFPALVRVGLLQECMAVEYVGPEKEDDDKFPSEFIFQPEQTVLNFLGIDLTHFAKPNALPAPGDVHNMAFFLGDSVDYLFE